MIVKTILGNIKDYDTKGKSIDKVKVSPDDRLKHILRLKSDSGIEIGVSLDGGHFHNGDVLAEDDTRIFVVDCLPQNVIVIKAKDMMQMGFVAHSIGNRHTPAVFEDGMMIVEDDYLIAQWLDENKVEYERTSKVLRHALKHASHHH
ncbi:urease accessory protein UreE [Campylobacter canadensis]|uniref:Urease accessory protein UreE n=1 Tax=Campylobacter canadensis TaxID=449520 RepID=A0ABS7WSG2_9BACT|nr:urease accessory protein UreE [Campylobacter canadensis]MBZ7987262.1 urease accessory protein UreE [Campylobacter canadensis]MBZ7994340.1 urease accessory protein UreE [Campylobacter canadensis]MBZ7996037.1 urease accessory protein UreE [Campylobacter canadensis]MBZ7998309.1 urease accessory protein UreE [Campylobacter canadensis]MBZ7999673.1 urease accessory protein UreE [Campylobacter canadensis]